MTQQPQPSPNPQTQNEVIIIHLSDLHFSGYLQNVHGEGEWNYVAKPQDFNLLLGMEAHVKALLGRYHDRALVVVTGDLTTAAEPPAYELVSTYLRGKVWVNGQTTVGLGLFENEKMKDRLFVVPGNHDNWVRTKLWTQWSKYTDRRKLFRQYFGSLEGNQIRPIILGGISFLIFMLDSNELQGHNWFNIGNALGRGRVGEHQRAQIQAEYQALNANHSKLPTGFDMDNAFRIALMHHHPAIPDNVPKDIEQNLLKLEDAAEVKDLLVNQLGVSLVLCGHQHFPFIYPDGETAEDKPWLSCSGSATQRACQVNSFKVYKVTSNSPAAVTMQEFRRDNTQGQAKFTPLAEVQI